MQSPTNCSYQLVMTRLPASKPLRDGSTDWTSPDCEQTETPAVNTDYPGSDCLSLMIL